MRLRKHKKYTVLVSGASGIVGYGIVRSLKNNDCTVIGTTIYDVSPADCFSDIVEKPPMTMSDEYIPWLKRKIREYGIDMLIPGIEADMASWNHNREVFEETEVYPVLNNADLIDLCLDKWEFYQVLKKNDCKYRIESTLEAKYTYFPTPFILKPRCGFGSRGIVKVENQQQFDFYKDKIGEELFMQEFIGSTDEECTISAFFDKDSKMKALIGLKRKLSKQGFTEVAEVIHTEMFLEILEELADIFHPVGPTNFQFRKQGEFWKLLEINPRISSSTSIRKAFGYNESQMCVDYFLLGKEIAQPKIRKGKAIRYTEDYIFYDSNDI